MHLFLGLCDAETGVAILLLADAGVDQGVGSSELAHGYFDLGYLEDCFFLAKPWSIPDQRSTERT